MPLAPRHPPSAWRCIRRALELRCPECGISPMFVPARKVKSLFDWFTPLDGCPRCGYAYEREHGYFLLAVWGLNYGLVGGLGLIGGLLIQHYQHPPVWSAWWLLLLPVPLCSFLFARHAKALFLAMDHYIDPHVSHGRGGDDTSAIDEDGHEHPTQP
jgi:uncharacterized protein (DUF983 family)